MRKYLIIITLLIFSCNSEHSEETSISKIEQHVGLVDSLISINQLSQRVFVLTDDSKIPNEVYDFENWEENIIETYNIFLDKRNEPKAILVIPYSESGDWSLIHSYYFNEHGNTEFYQFYLASFNSLCADILREYKDLYFNDEFEILEKKDRFEDENHKQIENTENCENLYSFDLSYLGFNNAIKILENYQIKL